MQVRQEAAPAPVVRVRDAIARGGALASDFADAGHKLNLYDQLVTECRITRTDRWGRALYQPQSLPARRGGTVRGGGRWPAQVAGQVYDSRRHQIRSIKGGPMNAGIRHRGALRLAACAIVGDWR